MLKAGTSERTGAQNLTRRPKLILYAPRVHTGGGLVLLKSLLDALGDQVIAILDRRCPAEASDGAVSIRIKPGLSSYFFGEKVLDQMSRTYPNVPILCFSSLPPCRSFEVPTTVFLQNRYVVENGKTGLFSVRVRFRLWLERLWFGIFRRHADRFIVQSRSMADTVKRKFPELETEIAPFVESMGQATADLQNASEKFDFLFISAVYPHKNHGRLLEAWRLLAHEGHFPTLALVFSEDGDGALASAITQMNATDGTKIIQLPEVPPAERFSLYTRAKALIFPSYFETYGLPLVEAAAAGLPILAPELDYVRDSVAPRETFDPHSAISIARAVRRFLGLDEIPKKPLSAEEFIAHISVSPS